MSLKKGLFGLGMFILFSGMVNAKTVKVDCFKGKSINKALNANKNVEELTIEIDGICKEDVIVQRDNLTLIGINLDGSGNPTDGIEADSTDPDAPPALGAVLWIRDAFNVRVESLILSEGARHGLRVIDSFLIVVDNCILEDNDLRGLLVRTSGVQVEFSTLRENGNGGANVGSGARVTFADGEIDESSSAVLVNNEATVILRRMEVDGSFQAIRKSLIQLFNTDQNDNPDENIISDDSQLQADSNSEVRGPSTFSVFSTGFFEVVVARKAKHIGSTMTCESGSDVFCDEPANQITGGGTSIDCSSCTP